MSEANLIHAGVTIFLFLLFVGCVVKAMNPDKSKWWLGGMIFFLVASALAAGWTGWDVT